ncbi:MAG: hypothetical protein H6562_01690 [Lewinellaceae bacterium]|nr:hypothetical protein [Lewinella sp.]MCB9277602.1 hypothetical protein [Lewinellaceae bacterium]
MKTIHKSGIILPFLFLLTLLSQKAFSQANSGVNPELVFYKHYYGNGIAQPIKTLDDSLGTIRFRAMVGPGPIWQEGASITARATGTFGPDSMPASLIFRTGGPSQLDRMIITHGGLVGIGTNHPAFNLHTIGNTATTGDFYGRLHVDDNQSTDDAPDTYIDEAYFELKNRNILGAPAGPGNLGGLLTVAPGGTSFDHQLFFANDGIFHRRWDGNANTWTGSTWYKILTGEDINGTTNHIAKFTGPNSLGDSRLWDDGVRVGIGTTTPNLSFLLTVNGNTKINGGLNADDNISAGQSVTALQNVSAGQDVIAGDDVTAGSNISAGNSLSAVNDLSVGDDATIGGDAAVGNDVTAGGDITAGQHIFANGNVAIGTTSMPGSHRLYVAGSMICTEAKVALQTNWPDYVFEKDYQKPDLKEWERFITENKHLPGVPSAQQVRENGGIELGETQRVLLEKIEELTLIVIEQQKQIDALKAGMPKH